MRVLRCLLTVSSILSLAILNAQPAATPPSSEQHEYHIANFKTESGVTLPEARIMYGVYGRLNAANPRLAMP